MGKINNKEILEELERRINITHDIRIKAAKRLRKNDNEYKKFNMYYTALVTIISILSIGVEKSIYGISISTISLICSIILTYFMFYVSEKNLQERAYKMEQTYRELDKLRNKIFIKIQNHETLKEEECKKFFSKYERIIAGIENHEQIDYDSYVIEAICREKKNINIKALEIEDCKKRLNYYTRKNKAKKMLKYIIPIVGLIIVFILAK